MLIEVFRAGSPAAIAAGITAADLADVASFDCANNPVPNVIGHPLTNSPANGAVTRFEARGDTLFADVPEKLPAFASVVKGIKDGTILNRSMAFFGKRHASNPTPGKLAPMHLGFLGGAVPGVAGMPALASYFAANPASAFTFAADGETLEVVGVPMDAVVVEPAAAAPTGVVTITDPAAPAATPPATPAATQEPAVATEPTQAEKDLAERIRLQDEREKTFAADQRTAREGANAATVAALVKDTKVLPADEKDLVAAFNAIDDDQRKAGDVIAFASDANKAKASPVSIIAGIMAKAGAAVPAVDAGQLTPNGDAPAFSAGGGSGGDELAKARADRLAKYGK